MIAVFAKIDGKLARFHVEMDDHEAAIVAVENELASLNPAVHRTPALALFERAPFTIALKEL